MPDLEPEPDALPEPTPLHVPPSEPDPPAAAEQIAPEPEAMLDEDAVAAALTGALDSLGTAHHRPFSRS